MKTTKSGGLFSLLCAAALGSFIGTLAALKLADIGGWSRHLAWAGFVLGGLVAYCIVDYKMLVSGIRPAFHEAITWRPHWPYTKAYTANLLWSLVCVVPWVLLLLGGTYLVLCSDPRNEMEPFAKLGLRVFFAGLFLITTYTFTFKGCRDINTPKYWCTTEEANDALNAAYERRIEWIKRYNFPLITWWLMLGTIRLLSDLCDWLADQLLLMPDRVINTLVWTKNACRESSKALWKFFVGSFIYVHSDRRAVCFIAALIGSGAGYFAGNAFIGALVGAATGFIEYQLISVRLLKLNTSAT